MMRKLRFPVVLTVFYASASVLAARQGWIIQPLIFVGFAAAAIDYLRCVTGIPSGRLARGAYAAMLVLSVMIGVMTTGADLLPELAQALNSYGPDVDPSRVYLAAFVKALVMIGPVVVVMAFAIVGARNWLDESFGEVGQWQPLAQRATGGVRYRLLNWQTLRWLGVPNALMLAWGLMNQRLSRPVRNIPGLLVVIFIMMLLLSLFIIGVLVTPTALGPANPAQWYDLTPLVTSCAVLFVIALFGDRLSQAVFERVATPWRLWPFLLAIMAMTTVATLGYYWLPEEVNSRTAAFIYSLYPGTIALIEIGLVILCAADVEDPLPVAPVGAEWFAMVPLALVGVGLSTRWTWLLAQQWQVIAGMLTVASLLVLCALFLPRHPFTRARARVAWLLLGLTVGLGLVMASADGILNNFGLVQTALGAAIALVLLSSASSVSRHLTADKAVSSSDIWRSAWITAAASAILCVPLLALVFVAYPRELITLADFRWCGSALAATLLVGVIVPLFVAWQLSLYKVWVRKKVAKGIT